MILEKGDMWSVFGNTDIFMLTTNPIRRKDGAVVMGRGIALQAKTRFPYLPFEFGEQLKVYEYARSYIDPLATVNVGVIGRFDEQVIGWFMTKDHWRDSSKLEIIKRSTEDLNSLSRNIENEGETLRIDLNFPGIGNGKLQRSAVLPIIEMLPDNVHVWELA